MSIVCSQLSTYRLDDQADEQDNLTSGCCSHSEIPSSCWTPGANGSLRTICTVYGTDRLLEGIFM